MSALTSPYRSALPTIRERSYTTTAEYAHKPPTTPRTTSKSVTSSWITLSMTSPLSRALSSSTYFHPDTGAPTGPFREGFNDFVLLFGRSRGTPTVYYLMVDPYRRGRLLPKVYMVLLNKVKDIEDYRVVTLDNLLYITGGRNMQSNCILSLTYRFDCSDNSWCRLASMHVARCNHAAVSLKELIYVTGGESKYGRVTGSMECYDPSVNQWTQLRSMPEERTRHSCCVLQDRIYITGGVGLGSKAISNNQTFWQYEPKIDFWWKASSHLPGYGRQDHLTVGYKGNLFCLSGLSWGRVDGKVEQSDNCSIVSFDCSKATTDGSIHGHWDKSHPSSSNPRHSAAVVLIGHNLYAIGGVNANTGKTVHQVEYYNLRKRRWYEAFSLGEDVIVDNVDAAVIRIPISNTWFSHMAPAIRPTWTLW